MSLEVQIVWRVYPFMKMGAVFEHFSRALCRRDPAVAAVADELRAAAEADGGESALMRLLGGGEEAVLAALDDYLRCDAQQHAIWYWLYPIYVLRPYSSLVYIPGPAERDMGQVAQC